MPEGPSIVILKEAAMKFRGRKVRKAGGNTQKIDTGLLTGKKVLDVKSWGKHFLICFSGFTLRIHFLLYGSYLIDEEKETPERLWLEFSNGTIRFYACSVRLIPGTPDEVYDWSADVLSPAWNPEAALGKLKDRPGTIVADALLDQDIFAGVGNIIKNEVLFRIRVHPESLVGKLPEKKLRELVTQAVEYSRDFLAWKKEFTLRKHYRIYHRKTCPRDLVPVKREIMGRFRRRTYYCPVCQELYR